MNATVIANLSFILFWLIVIGVILLSDQHWSPLATLRHKMRAQWQPALAIALIALVSSGLRGAGLLNLYVPAIFCQALLGLAVARSIAGFEPLAVWAAWRQGTRAWRTLALTLVTALAAVGGVLIGTVGISIARQLVHETYDMSATTEAGQALTLSKRQLFFYFLWGGGIAEETTYRLVALSLLWHWMRRRWPAIVLSAVIFGLYHLTPLAGSYRTFWQFPLAQVFSSVLLGLVWVMYTSNVGSRRWCWRTR